MAATRQHQQSRPKAAARAKASKAKASRDAIVKMLDKALRTSDIPDSSVNGLQVEGTAEITRVGLAVDACIDAYKLAEQKGCQMVIAHHGLIWDGLKRVTGPAYKHIEFLVKRDINLYASHLPLDMHPALGNNALLAKAVNLKNIQPFGVYTNGMHIGFEGYFARAETLKSLAEKIKKAFGGPITTLPFGPQKIWRAAVIAGRGSSALAEAVEKKIDLLITGEVIHESHHIALEGNINVICGGHYHTEKAGVQALGDFLRKKFGIDTVFLDVPTLV